MNTQWEMAGSMTCEVCGKRAETMGHGPVIVTRIYTRVCMGEDQHWWAHQLRPKVKANV